MRARDLRKARLARRAKTTVARIIKGIIEKVTSASWALSDSMTMMMPASIKLSPVMVIKPCESSWLMTPTSLMTREMVTPTM